MNTNPATPPCVCTTIRKADRAIHRPYEAALQDAEVSIVQFALLRALQRNGDMRLPDLAADQWMDRTSLYRTMAPLVDHGAIQLQRAPTGNTKVATLTPRGERLIERTLPLWAQAQATVVSRIGQQHWQALAEEILNLPDVLALDDA